MRSIQIYVQTRYNGLYQYWFQLHVHTCTCTANVKVTMALGCIVGRVGASKPDESAAHRNLTKMLRIEV